MNLARHECGECILDTQGTKVRTNRRNADGFPSITGFSQPIRLGQSSAYLEPTSCVRYFDIFVIWRHGKNDLNKSLNQFNSSSKDQIFHEDRREPIVTFSGCNIVHIRRQQSKSHHLQKKTQMKSYPHSN